MCEVMRIFCFLARRMESWDCWPKPVMVCVAFGRGPPFFLSDRCIVELFRVCQRCGRGRRAESTALTELFALFHVLKGEKGSTSVWSTIHTVKILSLNCR